MDAPRCAPKSNALVAAQLNEVSALEGLLSEP